MVSRGARWGWLRLCCRETVAELLLQAMSVDSGRSLGEKARWGWLLW